ncbi:MAG TPA: biotin/lipoyl-binding protein [Arachnia sp.]|nr:biotin/lipoyl-binding protein [Arachnia sp.]
MSPRKDGRRKLRLWPRTAKARVLVVAAAVVVATGIAAGTWYFWPREEAAQSVRQEVTVSPTTLKTTVSASGTLEPERQADLSFGSSSAVETVDVAVGDKVEKGDTLATIDDASPRIALSSAKADLTAAKETLSDLEDDDDASDASIRAAEANVKVKSNAVTQAETNLDNASLTAPFDGIVAQVNVEEGDSTGSGSGGSGGDSSMGAMSGTSSSTASTSADIVLITDDSFVVSTSVTSADIASVKRGLQAELTVSGRDEPIYGTVDSVAVQASSSSSGTSSFPVTIDVTGNPEGLFAGSSVTVAIVTAQHTDVLAVSASAITTTDGTSTVVKLVDGVDTPTEVTTGETIDGSTIITAGLAEGDTIVVETFIPSFTGGSGGGNQENPFGNGGFPGGGFPGGGELPAGGSGGFPGGTGGFPGGGTGGNR